MSAHRSSDLDSSMHASNLAVNWWALSFHAVVFTPEGKTQLSFYRKYCKGIKKNRSVLGPIYLSAIQWVSLVQSARPALGIHWLVLISARKKYEPFGTGWKPQSTTPQRGELVLSLFGARDGSAFQSKERLDTGFSRWHGQSNHPARRACKHTFVRYLCQEQTGRVSSLPRHHMWYQCRWYPLFPILLFTSHIMSSLP